MFGNTLFSLKYSLHSQYWKLLNHATRSKLCPKLRYDVDAQFRYDNDAQLRYDEDAQLSYDEPLPGVTYVSRGVDPSAKC